jgi:DNA replication protein DnaC
MGKVNYNSIATPVEAWHEIIGQQLLQMHIDRLVHTAHRINIKGESYA